MIRLEQFLWKNTTTNYLRLGLGMLCAVFATRIIFLGMGEHLYGFWSLLWAVFGYSLLLDFGFGRTVKKYTAEADYQRDPQGYSRIISAVFCSYLLEAALIGSAAWIAARHVGDIFRLPPEADAAYYRQAFLVFGLGIALVFPSGIFPEILGGLNRFYLRNYVLIGNKLLELTGIAVIFSCGGSLLSLAIFTAALNLSTNLVMAAMVFRLMPELRFTFSGVRLGTFRRIADFSAFAYILTIADMLILKTDRLVLGIMTGVSSVSIYQLGTRIPEMAGYLSSQFQESLAPLAASLHKDGEHERLRSIMMSSTRLTVFLSTAVFLILSLLSPAIMFVWLRVADREVLRVAAIMLVSGYIMIIMRSASTHFLFMTGRHRFVAILTIAESIANLGLTLLLVRRYGAVGAATGTLIPNVLISMLVVFPVFARFGGHSIWAYVFRAYLPPILSAIPAALLLGWLTWKIPAAEWSVLSLAAAAGAGGFLYLTVGWLLAVRHEEKVLLLAPVPLPHRLRTLLTGTCGHKE